MLEDYGAMATNVTQEHYNELNKVLVMFETRVTLADMKDFKKYMHLWALPKNIF